MIAAIPPTIRFSCRDGAIVNIHTRVSGRAKRFTLKLSDGIFSLVVPKGASEQALSSAMRHFSDWIEDRHIESLLYNNNKELPKTIEFPLEKKTYTVSLYPTLNDLYTRIAEAKGLSYARPRDSSKVIYCLEFENSVELHGDVEMKQLGAYALQIWSRRKADILLVKYVRKVAKDLNISIAKVTVRDQKSRWGSCSGKMGQLFNISINWRALLLPVELVTHLCHHELCHVSHMNHSPEFHKKMLEINPHAEDLEDQLNRAWKKLPWWSKHIEFLD